MPDIPKGHKVIDTVKDNKGFYRIIERPDGTKYSQTLKLFTEQDNDRKVRAENKSLGQLSTTNIKGNMANAMALTAVGGGATALALHNATQGRQGKVGRKVRGAAFGSTRPQGAGLKTPAGTAGDVRGRVSPNRPPAIVRSVDSFNQRGSTMPQTGDLFSQPEPPSGGTKKAGTRYAPAGTAKATGKGTRGVPRPAPRSSGKPTGSTTKTPATQARPTPLAPSRLAGSPIRPKFRPSPLQPPMPSKILDSPTNTYTRPGYSEGYLPGGGRPPVKGPGGTEIRPGQGSIYDVRSKYDPNRLATRQGLPGRIQPQLSGAAQAAQEMASKSSASSGAKKAGTRYAPAGTAKATGKGTRGVPRPSPRSNFKPATGSKPTGGMPAQLSQMPPGGAGPTAPGRTNVAGAINQSKMPAQFRQMPPSGAGPTAPGRTNIPGIPKGGGVGGFFKGVGRVLSNPMVAVASAIDMADKATNFRRIPYTGNFGGPSFAKNPYASTSGNPDAKPAGKKETTAPAATAPAPAQSGGNKPAGGQKPYEPRYFPEAGGNGNAVRKPDSYLGEAFDYSLQKGTTSGTKYLEHMFRRDKVSEDDQQRLRERFNKKVVGDQTLQEYGADKGITQTLEGKKSGLGEALLGKYRDTGTYKGNTDYDVMRAAAEARMARK